MLGVLKVKKTFEIVSVYIGLIIGAGFASGREIFEYFNIGSRHNLIGIIVAIIFFAIIAYITMSSSRTLGVDDFDSFITETTGAFSLPVKIFMLLYMFCGFFIMLSGSGILIAKTFSVDSSFGIVLLSFICFITFSFDMKGIIAINTIMVPIMILGISFLCFSSIYTGVPSFAHFSEIKRNPIISAICYVGYNTITAGAVLIPLSKNETQQQLKKATLISSFILGFLIFIVWNTLNIHYDAIYEAEMPLLEIAFLQGKLYDNIYTLVLFMALCTTAVSHGFGIMSKFKPKCFFDRTLIAAALCLFAMPFAKIGFANLIANLYAAFGIVGVFWMIWLIIKYLKISNHN